ncbi:iron-containing alcohol dehydrogenase [Oerskovia sp. M15]
MAFGNAFLGIVHAMAHTVGSTFGLVHGRTNAIFLPHAIRYNGQIPTKVTGWPKAEKYIAHERYQQIAKHLGLRRRPRAGRRVLRPGRRGAAGQGRDRALVHGAGRLGARVHGRSRRPGDAGLRGPVRSGQPAPADARGHEGHHGRGLPRHEPRRGPCRAQGHRGGARARRGRRTLGMIGAPASGEQPGRW